MKQTAIVAGLLAVAVAAGAEDDGNRAAPNATVVHVPEIRTEPPHGLFKLFVGDLVEGAVGVGDKVRVVAVNKYYGFKGTHLWFQIELSRQNGEIDGPVWAYAGIREGKMPLAVALDALDLVAKPEGT